ncbi:MAG TPA: CarD family transcriptional regulator [Bacilli bacterium]|nr:CarD family transcriptional regulator [Bacilli bacterium]
MFKVNDYVIYKNDTCIIKNTKNMRGRDYYSLSPIDDLSLNIDVSIENNLGHIRSIISKSEVEQIISSIPMVECIEFENEKMFESEYKRILASGKYEDLIKIIKTSFLRNDARLLNNKRISEKDDFYFKKAEKILYNEFSIALGLTYDETKKYVIDRVTKLSNKKS